MTHSLPLGQALAAVQQRSPLVHCISNTVAANDCANIVLACGASPIMADDPEESSQITAMAQALTLSLGTPSPRKAEAMLKSGRQAAALGLPVVFDPVGVGASGFRQGIARQLMAEVPLTVLRANAAELQALCGLGRPERGVDADTRETGTLADRAKLAAEFAAAHHCVAAITGETDLVTDGSRTYAIHNGHPLMQRITGAGCMLTVLAGAFVGADPEHPLEAAAAAVCAIGLCGQLAVQRMTGQDGTGSCRVYLMDAVSRLTPSQLEQGADYELLC